MSTSKLFGSTVTGVLLLLVSLLVACAPTSGPAPSRGATAPAPPAGGASGAPGAAAPAPSKEPVKVGFVSAAASISLAPIWTALEEGLFLKNGLDVDFSYLGGDPLAMNTLISDQVQFALTGGPGPINTALAGSDPVIIAALFNKGTFGLMVRPEIKTVQDLKGQSVAVTSLGGSTRTAIVYMLREVGIAESEVRIVAIPAHPDKIAALGTNAIQGALMGMPFTWRAQKEGFVKLKDMVDMDLETASSVISVRRSYIPGHETEIKALLKTIVEGIHRLKTDKAAAVKAMGKWLQTDDQELLDASYDDIVRRIPNLPKPTVKAVQSVIEDVALQNPAAEGAKAETFMDMRFIEEIERSGILQQLFGR